MQELFRVEYGEVFRVPVPTSQERRDFFEDLLLNQAAKAPVSKRKAGKKEKKKEKQGLFRCLKGLESIKCLTVLDIQTAQFVAKWNLMGFFLENVI